jgi:hypothetical protein
MNPEEQQNPDIPVYTGDSLEYLEQIAPKKRRHLMVLDRRVIVIIVLIAAAVAVFIAYLAVTSAAKAPSSGVLSARLTGLDELIVYGKGDKINDSNIKKTLAEAQAIITSDKLQLAKVATLESPNSEVLANESVKEDLATLDKAQSTGNLSTKYTQSLLAQIEKVRLSLAEVREKSGDQSVIDSIDKLDSDLSEIAKRLPVY